MLDLVLLMLPYTKLQPYLSKMTIPLLPMKNKYTVLQPKEMEQNITEYQ